MSALILPSTHGGSRPCSFSPVTNCPCCNSSDHIHTHSVGIPSSDKKENPSKKSFLIDGYELDIESPILIVNDLQSSTFDDSSLNSSMEAPSDSDLKDSQAVEGKNNFINSRKKRKTLSQKSNEDAKEKIEGIPLPSWRLREDDEIENKEWSEEENIIEPPDVLIELRHLIHELEEKIRFQWDNKKLIKRLQVQLRRLISLMSNLQYYNINVVYNNTPSSLSGSPAITLNETIDKGNDVTSSTGLGIGLSAEKLKKRRGRKKKNIPTSVNLDSIIADVRARCQKYCDMYAHLSARYSGMKRFFPISTDSTFHSTKRRRSVDVPGSPSEDDVDLQRVDQEDADEDEAFWPVEENPKEIKQEPTVEVQVEENRYEEVATPVSEHTASDKEFDEESEGNGSGDDYISDFLMNEEDDDFEVNRGRAKVSSKRPGRKSLSKNESSNKRGRKKRNLSKTSSLDSLKEEHQDYSVNDGSSPEAILEDSSDSFSNESKSRKKQRKPKYYYSFAFSSNPNQYNLSSPMSDIPNIHETSASPSIHSTSHSTEGPQKITTDLIPFLEDILGGHKETSEGSTDDILSIYKSMYSSKASVDGDLSKKGKGRRGRKKSSCKLNQVKMTCEAPEWYSYDHSDGNGLSILDCMSLDFIDMDSYVYVRMCGKGANKSTSECNSSSGSGSSTASSSDSEDSSKYTIHHNSSTLPTSENWQAWTLSHSTPHPSCDSLPVSTSFATPHSTFANTSANTKQASDDFFVSSLLEEGFGDLSNDFIPCIPQSHSIVVSVSVVPFTLKI